DPTNQKNKKNPTYTYLTEGIFSVTLQATSNFGCTNSIQKPVPISKSPQAMFTNTTPICAGADKITQFSSAGSTGNITYYQWTIQNSIIAGPAKDVISYPFSISSSAIPV